MDIENTYKNLPKDQKYAAVKKEMMPYFVYAVIPVILTICIAFIFGPSLT